MALGLKGLGSSNAAGVSQKQLLELLAQQGVQKPRANILERILGLPAAVGSVPDVLFNTMYRGKNPITEYLGNLGEGLKTTFLGEKPEVRKTTSDIFKRMGFTSQDPVSKVTRGVLGFAGDVALDPMTYVSFGTIGLGKKAAMETIEAGIAKTGASLADDVLKEGTETLAEKGLKDFVNSMTGKIDDVTLQEIGKTAIERGFKNQRILKLLGKEVSRTPGVVTGVEALANPLGVLGRGAGKIAEAAAPEAMASVRKGFANIFSPQKFAEEAKVSELPDVLRLERYRTRAAYPLEEAAWRDWSAKAAEMTPLQRKMFGGVVQGQYKVKDKLVNNLATEYIERFKPYEQELISRKLIVPAQDLTEEELKQYVKKYGVFPVLQEHLRTSKGKAVRALGFYEPRPGKVPAETINMFSDKAAMMNKGMARSEIASHEIGHAVNDMLPASTVKEFKDEIHRILIGPNKELFKSNVLTASNAQKNFREKFANAFEKYSRGKELYSPKLKALFDAIPATVEKPIGRESTVFLKGLGRMTPQGAGKLPEVKAITKEINAIKSSDEYREALENFKLLNWQSMKSGANIDDLADSFGESGTQALENYRLMRKRIEDLEQEKFGLAEAAIAKAVKAVKTTPSIPSATVPEVLQPLTKTQPETGPLDLTKLTRQTALAPTQVKTLLPRSYLSQDIAGAYPKAIRENMTPIDAEKILSSPEAKRDIARFGAVSKQTIDDIMGGVEWGREVPWSVRAKMKGHAAQKTYETLGAGEKAGWIYNKDWDQVVAKSAARSHATADSYDIAVNLHNFKDDVGQQRFFTTAEAKALGNGTIPHTLTQIEFKGTGIRYYTDKDSYQLVKQFTENLITEPGTKSVLTAYDKMLRAWKSIVTGKGPGFIGYNVRNAFGDMFNMIMDGHRIGRIGANLKIGADVLGFDHMAREGEGLEAATKKYGQQIKELWERAWNNGTLTTYGQSAEEAGMRLATETGAPAVEGGIKGLLKKADTAVTKVTTLGGRTLDREKIFRVAHLWDTYERTGDWGKAAEAVRRTLFNYDELTPIERDVFKRVIPFYTWMRKNFEFHLTNYANNPGKYQVMRHLFENIQKNLGADMTEEDWAALPEWMKTGLSVALGKSGQNARIMTSFGLPIESIQRLLGGGPKDTIMQLLSSMAPPLKVPLELATGQNFYTKKPIITESYGGRYAQYPEWMKKLLGYQEAQVQGKTGPYTKQTVDPIAAYLLQNTPLLGSLSTQYKRGLEVAEEPTNIMQLLTGSRIYSRNLEQEAEARQREQQEAILQFLARKGMASQYTNYSVPVSMREKLVSGQ